MDMSEANMSKYYPPKAVIGFAIGVLTLAGTVFGAGVVTAGFVDVPEQVQQNTAAITHNQETIQSTNQKIDAVLCLLVQESMAASGQSINPLVCLSGEGYSWESILGDSQRTSPPRGQ